MRGKLFQGLLRFSDRMQALPELAESWAIDPDGERCVFTLRAGVRFHDESRLTPDDVVASLHRARTRADIGPSAWDCLHAAEALDGRRVAIRAAGRIDRLLPLFDGMSCPILRQRDLDGLDPSPSPIGTGPFRLRRWKPGVGIALERNDAYWRPDQPLLGGIAYHVQPEAEARFQAMRAGSAQLAQLHDVAPVDLVSLRAPQGLRRETGCPAYAAACCRLLLDTARLPALADLRVRQALDLAVDRADLVERAWAGLARVSAGPMPAAWSLVRPEPVRRDLRRAAALLDVAGLRPDDQGLRLRLSLLLPDWEPVWARVGQGLAAALRQAGIEVQPEPCGRPDWRARLEGGGHDMVLRTEPLSGGILPGLATRMPQSEFAELLRQPDGPALAEAMAAAERRAIAGMNAIWLFEPLYPILRAENLVNVEGFATGVFAPFDTVFFA